MSASIPHLYKNRHGTYYLRIISSLKQQGHGAKREKWLSLKTKDRQQAKIFALTFALQKAQDQMPKNLFNQLKITAKDGESIDFELSNPAEAAYAKQWKLEKDRELASLNLEANPEEIQGRLEQFRAPSTKPAGKRLAQVMEDYFKLKGATLAPRTAKKYRSNVNRFLVWAGEKITIEEITPAKWHDFKIYLATDDPANGKAALHPKTIDLFTASISNVLKMTQGKNHVLTGQLLVKKSQRQKDAGAKHVFSPEELVKIFDPKRMNLLIDPADFWGVLIGLFSGARLNEIFQLRVADIRIVGGVQVFDIQEASEGNTLKTASSPRLIPIHDTLIEIGFMDYIQDILSLPNASNLTLLFPYLNRYEQGYGDVPSQRFTAMLQDLNIHQKRLKTFHSMRHTVNQKMKEGAVSREWREMFLGQKGEKEYVNDGYGGKVPVSTLKEVVMPALQFHEIEWQKIKPNRQLLKHTLFRETEIRRKANAHKVAANKREASK